MEISFKKSGDALERTTKSTVIEYISPTEHKIQCQARIAALQAEIARLQKEISDAAVAKQA